VITPNSITFTVANINVPVDVSSAEFRYLIIKNQPTGSNVQIQTQDSLGKMSAYYPVQGGDTFDFGTQVRKLNMICDTVGVVNFKTSDDTVFRTADATSVSVVIPGEVEVEGPYASGSVLTGPNQPVLIGGVDQLNNQAQTVNIVDGSNIGAAPLAPIVATQNIPQSTNILLLTNTDGIAQYQCMLLDLNVPGGATLTLEGQDAATVLTALSVFDIHGNLVSDAGVVSASGTYYIDLAGLQNVQAGTNAFGAGHVVLYACLSAYARETQSQPSSLTWGTNQYALAASGTPQQLTSLALTRARKLTILALPGNTGTITLGPSSAIALNTSGTNFPLAPGASVGLAVKNANLVWFDGTHTGDTIALIVETT
jgi:hypothetical protein